MALSLPPKNLQTYLSDYDVVGLNSHASSAGGDGGSGGVHLSNLSNSCPFMGISEKTELIEWVYKVPILFTLACNTAFLIWIMKVKHFTSPAQVPA